MPTYSKQSLDRLNTCDPRLIKVMMEVIKHFDCQVTTGHRNKEDQDKAFAEGKSQKKWPNGNHNTKPSLAVDVYPYPIDFNDIKRFYYFAGFVMGIAAQMGIKLRYGGDWNMDDQVKDNKFNDLVHFEVLD